MPAISHPPRRMPTAPPPHAPGPFTPTSVKRTVFAMTVNILFTAETCSISWLYFLSPATAYFVQSWNICPVHLRAFHAPQTHRACQWGRSHQTLRELLCRLPAPFSPRDFLSVFLSWEIPPPLVLCPQALGFYPHPHRLEGFFSKSMADIFWKTVQVLERSFSSLITGLITAGYRTLGCHYINSSHPFSAVSVTQGQLRSENIK